MPPLRDLVVSLGLVSAALGCTATPAHQPPSSPRGVSVDAPAAGAAYDVQFSVDPGNALVRVWATLGPLSESDVEDGQVDFAFARRYAFVTLPLEFVEAPTARKSGRLLAVERPDPFHLVVSTEGREPITLTWTLRVDERSHPEVLAGTDQYEHGYVSDSHGMLFTAALVPVPDVALAEARCTVTGKFGDAVITPWPEAARDRLGRRTWRPTPRDLGDDIVLLGNGWKTVTSTVRGLEATFAMSPGNEWVAPLAEELLIPIVEAEVEVFGWAPRERYLFVFGPSDGVRGYGGSPKTGSMTLFVDSDLDPSRARDGLGHLIAHEFHHTWGRASLQSEDALRFVDEGYTDYYAYLVPWRLGMLSDADFHLRLERKLAEGAKALQAYEQSLARAGGPEFFAGREAYDACYAAGLALALWTDLGLRQAGSEDGLDELMRTWYAATPGGRRVSRTLRDWIEALEERLPAADVLAYAAAVQSTADVNWEELFDRVQLVCEATEDGYQISPAVIERLR